MSQMVFINLVVADLPTSMRFYEALGFTNNPQFTDETAACMVLSDSIFVMLLTQDKARQFTTRPLADPKAAIAALYCVSRDSRESVDAFADAALGSGGAEHHAAQDLGFMYSRSVEDPDGHVWEPLYMDMAAAQAAFEEQEAA
jgi:uncharacterized protein